MISEIGVVITWIGHRDHLAAPGRKA